MKVASYEYVSVANWCRPVEPGALAAGPGNLAYFGQVPDEPPLKPVAFHVDTGIPDDMFDAARRFGMAFDPATLKKIPYPDRPFVARLEKVRVDKPNFSVFVDRHLVLAESYHTREATDESKAWYGPYATRREAAFDIEFPVGEEAAHARLDAKYYLDREPDLKLDRPAMLLSGPSFYNYHHWMMEILPRLSWAAVVPELQRLPIIVHAPLAPFQVETLAALGIGEDRLIPFPGLMIEAKTLFFPSYIAPGNLSIRNVEWIRDSLARAFGPPGKPTELIYVSRKGASSRRILNEDAVVAELARHGFKTVTLDAMSVRDQAALFGRARAVVMPHGAAATNMIFAPPGAALVEIVPAGGQHILYWVYTSLMGGRYGRLVCDDSRHPETRDVTVDMKALNAMLDQVLA